MLWLVLAALASLTLLVHTMFRSLGSFSFNVIEIRRKRPWIYEGPGLAKGLVALVATEFFCCSVGLLASILLALIARWSFTPTDPTDSGAAGRAPSPLAGRESLAPFCSHGIRRDSDVALVPPRVWRLPECL